MDGMDSIDKQVDVLLAIKRYLKAKDGFEQASTEFSESCAGLRSTLPAASEFVAKVDYKHYLVRTADNVDFDVKKIEVV